MEPANLLLLGWAALTCGKRTWVCRQAGRKAATSELAGLARHLHHVGGGNNGENVYRIKRVAITDVIAVIIHVGPPLL